MEDEYGMGDLRHYMSSRPLFPPNPIAQPPEFRGLNGYDMLVFRSDSTANASNTTSASAAAAASFSGFNCGSNGGGRWPRQETLTLLEIRSRLDPKFKEANQKGPLWDEVSRIMSEEYGYQRSGKKCREKFENLYKYYKKTKEGKAGRQDGKHYRFFRQLEALYGEANTSSSMSEPHPAAGATYLSKFSDNLARNHESIQCPKLSDTSLSLSNYSGGNSSSSDGNDPNEGINDHGEKMKKLSRWKVKVKDFIDAQMKKLMEKQETWMERMMRTIEDKERERMMREEEWRKQEVARMEREQKFWANERAWIEARDVALMEALHKLAGKESRAEEAMAAEIRSLSENQHDDGSETITNAAKGGDLWPECGINRTKMAAFGHDRSKEKWDNVNNYAIKCSKKRKEDSKSCIYFHSHESIFNCDTNDHHPIIQNHDHVHVSSSPNPNSVGAISESCFRYFMGDAYGRI